MQKNICDTEFVVIDVETTGRSAYDGRMTEIGMVKVLDGEIIDKYSTLINPEQFIPTFITQMTGITNEMVFSAPKFYEVKSKILSFLGENIFTGHNVAFDFSFVNSSFIREANIDLKNERLCTCKLARRILPVLKSKSLESLIRHYKIEVEARHRALDDAIATAQILLIFLDYLEQRNDITTLDEILHFQNKPVFSIKKPPKNFILLKETLQSLPEQSGVYYFRNKEDELLYIGKAKSLKDRVNSYFHHNEGHSKKIYDLVREVHSIKYETTGTELSALLLESKEIKKHKPPYNTAQVRFRKYPFLKINSNHEFPFLEWNYDIENDGADYFGPFVSRYQVEEFIGTLNKIFMLRECKEQNPNNKFRCIYPEINRCTAPCRNNDKEKYYEETFKVINFLNGEGEDLLKKFEEIMISRAEDMRFEEAAEMRDKIKMIKSYMKRHSRLPNSINKTDYIIVVPSLRTSFEIFIIKAGKIITNKVFNKFEKKSVYDLLENNYFSNKLFKNDYSSYKPFQIHILIGWIYKNFDDIKVLKVTEDYDRKLLLNEIKKYLEKE